MTLLTIGQVAVQAGVESSTLRYYESIGLLENPSRVGGQRRYEPDILKRLAMIQVAKEAGFTLPEINTLLSGLSETESPSDRWKRMAQDKIPEVDALIQRAQAMKTLLEAGLDCDCLRIDDCMLLFEN